MKNDFKDRKLKAIENVDIDKILNIKLISLGNFYKFFVVLRKVKITSLVEY